MKEESDHMNQGTLSLTVEPAAGGFSRGHTLRDEKVNAGLQEKADSSP